MSDRGISFDPRIALRPRSLDETYDLALRYVRCSSRDFVPLYAVTVLPALGIVILAALFFELSWGPRTALAVVLTTLLERIVTVFAGGHLFRSPSGIGGAVKALLPRLPLVLSSAVLVPLPLVLMFASGFEDGAAFGFGALLAVAWFFVLPSLLHLGEVAHLERLSFGRALPRTRVLLGHRYGRAIGALVFTGLIRGLFVVGAFFGLYFTMAFLLQFEASQTVVWEWASVAGYLASGPYVAVARLFDYVDARTRREGWDIQVRFNAIAQQAEEDAKRIAA